MGLACRDDPLIVALTSGETSCYTGAGKRRQPPQQVNDKFEGNEIVAARVSGADQRSPRTSVTGGIRSAKSDLVLIFLPPAIGNSVTEEPQTEGTFAPAG